METVYTDRVMMRSGVVSGADDEEERAAAWDAILTTVHRMEYRQERALPEVMRPVIGGEG
jgi:hypothetical protein